MTFKEAMREDLEVFMNLEEYGEWVELDGVKLKAQVEYHTGSRSQTEIVNKNDEFYVHPEKHNIKLIGEYLELDFKTADYGERIPKNTEYIHLNGKRYKVEESREEYGLTRLVCRSDRQNTLTRQMARVREL